MMPISGFRTIRCHRQSQFAKIKPDIDRVNYAEILRCDYFRLIFKVGAEKDTGRCGAETEI